MTASNFWHFVRFVLGGIANTAITYTLFLVLTQITSNFAAYTSSYVAGIGLSYLINTLLVFRSPMSFRSALQFPSVYLIQYLLGLTMLSLLTNAGVDSRIAMLVIIVVSIPVTFALTRFIIRSPRERKAQQ